MSIATSQHAMTLTASKIKFQEYLAGLFCGMIFLKLPRIGWFFNSSVDTSQLQPKAYALLLYQDDSFWEVRQYPQRDCAVLVRCLRSATGIFFVLILMGQTGQGQKHRSHAVSKAPQLAL
jgi:hypothetical protein